MICSGVIDVALKIALVTFLFCFDTAKGEQCSRDVTCESFALEKYNNSLKKFNTVEASFIQTSGAGCIKGKMYLKKPGKLRIIYERNSSGQRKEILCDGNYLTEYVFDVQGELEESSSVDFSETPLQIVLNTQGIDTRYVRIERVVSAKKNQDVYTYIYLVKKDDVMSGKVVLIFKEDKVEEPKFFGWIIYDEHHREIALELTEVNTNVVILPKTFSTSVSR
ncbi:outer membrane lipoprotein-sorting protein [Holospora obtusa F1]|uniref:Outer membrane lipoprotein-sorting protein n=1 Tax=Holospora obtusa F1 TaxID=1399147 RepID=W6TDT8_HOLOB|nr:outer-membrane lipoprotein carrier protein LolA [Holospora obtusa]ETZ06956.1 outer membrane lipoprotein-sorting protein [Holospora obtusa F1]